MLAQPEVRETAEDRQYSYDQVLEYSMEVMETVKWAKGVGYGPDEEAIRMIQTVHQELDADRHQNAAAILPKIKGRVLQRVNDHILSQVAELRARMGIEYFEEIANALSAIEQMVADRKTPAAWQKLAKAHEVLDKASPEQLDAAKGRAEHNRRMLRRPKLKSIFADYADPNL